MKLESTRLKRTIFLIVVILLLLLNSCVSVKKQALHNNKYDFDEIVYLKGHRVDSFTIENIYGPSLDLHFYDIRNTRTGNLVEYLEENAIEK